MSSEKKVIVFAFLMGVVSLLFIPTPLGRVSIFDLGCYFFAPLLFLLEINKYKRPEKLTILLSFLWLLGGILSDWYRDEPVKEAFKENLILFGVVCMLVVSFWILKKSPSAFIAFLVGNAFSRIISLYVFQNGALLHFAEIAGYAGSGGIQSFLIEKQVYPTYAYFVIIGFLLPLKKLTSLPWLPIVIGVFWTSFFLLFTGGSRSAFGIFFLVGCVMIGYGYFPRLLRKLVKHMGTTLMIALGVVVVVFQIYTYLAKNRYLGEGEYMKYYTEIEKGSALGSRNDIIVNWPFLWRSPIIGAGSRGLDKWGYVEQTETMLWISRGVPKFMLHSCLVGAWTKQGIFGLIFWAFAVVQVFKFLLKSIWMFPDVFPFIAYICFSMLWAFLFSPFGMFRGQAMMTLAIAVLANSGFYDILKMRASGMPYGNGAVSGNKHLPI